MKILPLTGLLTMFFSCTSPQTAKIPPSSVQQEVSKKNSIIPEIKGPGGLIYRIVVDKEGIKATNFDMVFMQRTIKLENDSIIFDSFGGNYWESTVVDPQDAEASWNSMLHLLSEGDSATFRLPNLAEFDHEKEFEGDYILYKIKIHKVIPSRGRTFEEMSHEYAQGQNELEEKNRILKRLEKKLQ